MLLWLMLAVMTAVVLAIAVQPLARQSSGPADAVPADDRAAHDLAVIRAQLAELDEDVARGTVTAVEAEAARVELSRRLLRAAESAAGTGSSAAVTPWRQRLMLATLVSVPLFSIALYTWQSRPIRLGGPEIAVGPDTETLVAQVEARLRAEPNDGRGWDVIAPVYRNLGRHQDAAKAYANAARLLGDSAARAAGEAEALIMAADGVVPAAALPALERAVTLDPTAVAPRYWRAVADEQAGRFDAARTAYQALLAELPAGASARSIVERRLAAIASAVAPGQAAPTLRPAEPGPTAADIEAAAGMSDADRTAMITGMVDGLAARLAANGRDPAGWQKLIRSYVVLGDTAKARVALASARQALAGDAAALAELANAARQVGLEP